MQFHVASELQWSLDKLLEEKSLKCLNKTVWRSPVMQRFHTAEGLRYGKAYRLYPLVLIFFLLDVVAGRY